MCVQRKWERQGIFYACYILEHLLLCEGGADADLIETNVGTPTVDLAVGAWKDVAGSKRPCIDKGQPADP